MVDLFWSVLQALVPPIDADPVHQYRWRVTVAAMLALIAVGETIHIGLECGYFRPYYSGFAQESDFLRAEDKLDTLIASGVEGDILGYRGKECGALKSTDPDAAQVRSFSLGQLQKALEAWKDSHDGSDYRLPSCEEMGL